MNLTDRQHLMRVSGNIFSVRTVEIPLTMDVSHERVERAITQAVADCELRVTMLGTLGKYPGCVHWHVKPGNEAGTLEITYWQKQQRAWFTIQSGRSGEWIEAEMAKLLAAVQIYLRE